MTDGQLIDRALKAQAVLENPAYREGYEATRNAIIALIEKTPLSDTQTAEDLRRCLKLLRDVQANFTVFMSQGRLASFKIEQQNQSKEREKRGLLSNFFR